MRGVLCVPACMPACAHTSIRVNFHVLWISSDMAQPLSRSSFFCVCACACARARFRTGFEPLPLLLWPRRHAPRCIDTIHALAHMRTNGDAHAHTHIRKGFTKRTQLVYAHGAEHKKAIKPPNRLPYVLLGLWLYMSFEQKHHTGQVSCSQCLSTLNMFSFHCSRIVQKFFFIYKYILYSLNYLLKYFPDSVMNLSTWFDCLCLFRVEYSHVNQSIIEASDPISHS